MNTTSTTSATVSSNDATGQNIQYGHIAIITIVPQKLHGAIATSESDPNVTFLLKSKTGREIGRPTKGSTLRADFQKPYDLYASPEAKLVGKKVLIDFSITQDPNRPKTLGWAPLMKKDEALFPVVQKKTENDVQAPPKGKLHPNAPAGSDTIGEIKKAVVAKKKQPRYPQRGHVRVANPDGTGQLTLQPLAKFLKDTRFGPNNVYYFWFAGAKKNSAPDQVKVIDPRVELDDNGKPVPFEKAREERPALALVA